MRQPSSQLNTVPGSSKNPSQASEGQIYGWTLPDSFPSSPHSTSVHAVGSVWKNNGMECSRTSWSMLFTDSLVSQKRHLGPEEPSGTAASWRGRLPWASLGLLRPSLDSEAPGGLELQVTAGTFCFVLLVCLFREGRHNF